LIDREVKDGDERRESSIEPSATVPTDVLGAASRSASAGLGEPCLTPKLFLRRGDILIKAQYNPELQTGT
jgi:hypothetical protein